MSNTIRPPNGPPRCTEWRKSERLTGPDRILGPNSSPVRRLKSKERRPMPDRETYTQYAAPPRFSAHQRFWGPGAMDPSTCRWRGPLHVPEDISRDPRACSRCVAGRLSDCMMVEWHDFLFSGATRDAEAAEANEFYRNVAQMAAAAAPIFSSPIRRGENLAAAGARTVRRKALFSEQERLRFLGVRLSVNTCPPQSPFLNAGRCWGDAREMQGRCVGGAGEMGCL